MVLTKQTRFTRDYRVPEAEIKNANCSDYMISRFMDGSASMTAEQLRLEWPNWEGWEQLDFCQSSCWLHKQADFPDMLRFVMRHGSPNTWSAVANSMAAYLPAEEVFGFLVDALGATQIGWGSNIIQAIATTKHPDAQVILRKHLEAIWQRPDLGREQAGFNEIAREAKTCIDNLVALGAPPAEFADKAFALSKYNSQFLVS